MGSPQPSSRRTPVNSRFLNPFRASALLATALLALAACTPAQGGDRAPAVGDDAPRAEASPSETGRSGAPGSAAEAAQEKRPPADRAWVIFGADTVVAEVARTPDERAEGLMYRDDVPDGTGMIFVFDDVQIRSFWMANTYVPLDIAHMDASFTIVDIIQMEPRTTESHEGAAPAMFALEVRQGWFAENGIEVGSRAEVVFGRMVGG